VESAEESLQAVDEEYAEVKKRSDDLEFWVEGFGNRGLKSFLIEAEIPEINRLATTYAQELLGIGAVVKLNATKALKTKDVVRENLTVEGSIPQCTESYAGASRGQKKRMDLSLLLAFRELVSTRQVRAFSQLFMDEIFDGLDPAGADTICELLQGIAAVCPVSLITHDKRIKPVADRVVLVCHKEGRAIIEGAAKGVTKNLGVKRKGVTKKAKKKVVKKVTKKVKRKKKPQKASKR
jgi:DNA repair exonuclease SbcCD ATPase subunit